MTYDLDYFIKKAEAIPKDEWWTHLFVNPMNPKQKCFRGHCLDDNYWYSCGGLPTTKEHDELIRLTGVGEISFIRISEVNNGDHPKYKQGHPKLRVLQFLKDLKDGVIV